MWRVGVRCVSPADTALGFSLLRHARPPALCSRVAAIFAPDDMRQTALVFLPEDSGTVARPIINFE